MMPIDYNLILNSCVQLLFPYYSIYFCNFNFFLLILSTALRYVSLNKEILID